MRQTQVRSDEGVLRGGYATEAVVEVVRCLLDTDGRAEGVRLVPVESKAHILCL
jgi:hypothetical protein